MINKITILISELVGTNLSKKEVISYAEEVLEDKRIKEIKKVLGTEDIKVVCGDLKQIDKLDIKGCILLLNNKLVQLYNFDKLFYNLYEKISKKVSRFFKN